MARKTRSEDARLACGGWATNAGFSSWTAFIESVTGGERLVAAHAFLDLDDAIAWCETELAKRLRVVRLANHQEYPEPSVEIRQAVLNRLRQYDVLTVRRLIPQTLSYWDQLRAQMLRTFENYREGFGLGLEGGYYFWYVLQKLDYTILDPSDPPGPISFDDDWPKIERAGYEWGAELAGLSVPFYTAIYSFTLGVHDWLRTCNLQQHLQTERQGQYTIQQILEDWKIQVGLS